MPEIPISRRTVLKAAASASVSAVLAGCGVLPSTPNQQPDNRLPSSRGETASPRLSHQDQVNSLRYQPKALRDLLPSMSDKQARASALDYLHKRRQEKIGALDLSLSARELKDYQKDHPRLSNQELAYCEKNGINYEIFASVKDVVTGTSVPYGSLIAVFGISYNDFKTLNINIGALAKRIHLVTQGGTVFNDAYFNLNNQGNGRASLKPNDLLKDGVIIAAFHQIYNTDSAKLNSQQQTDIETAARNYLADFSK